LIGNSNAISLLEKYANTLYLNWAELSYHKNICEILQRCKLVPLDLERMRENTRTFSEELSAYVFHPLRLERMAQQFGMEMDEYLEQI
jgi:hypothetical protein